MLAGLALLGVGAGVSALVVAGHHRVKPAVHAKAAAKKTVRPAHGLMLFPRSDPDAHAQNGAESIDSAR